LCARCDRVIGVVNSSGRIWFAAAVPREDLAMCSRLLLFLSGCLCCALFILLSHPLWSCPTSPTFLESLRILKAQEDRSQYLQQVLWEKKCNRERKQTIAVQLLEGQLDIREAVRRLRHHLAGDAFIRRQILHTERGQTEEEQLGEHLLGWITTNVQLDHWSAERTHRRLETLRRELANWLDSASD
jgi:hypothetical protein